MARKSYAPTNLLALSSDPASGHIGDAYFNTTSGVLRIYGESGWATSGSGGSGGSDGSSVFDDLLQGRPLDGGAASIGQNALIWSGGAAA